MKISYNKETDVLTIDGEQNLLLVPESNEFCLEENGDKPPCQMVITNFNFKKVPQEEIDKNFNHV